MGTRRTILFVAGAAFFSGAERALLLTVRSLLDAGHRPFVAVGTDGELLAQLSKEGIPAAYVPVRHTGLTTLPLWMTSIAQLCRIARREGAQIIHANEAPTSQMAGYAAKLLGIPAVTHVRFHATSAGFAWYLKSGFHRALFVSRALQQEAFREVPQLFEGRSDVVHDGVALRTPSPQTVRERRRAEVGIVCDRPTVVIAGQVIEIKGIFDFLAAARILRHQGVRAVFYVLGDDLRGQGAVRREAEAQTKALGLAEDVRFLGFRSDAPELIELFDIVTVPSHIEPLGNATLEAMAAGRAVVGSNVGGIPEMVVDGETGFLVPPKAPEQLAASLARLITDAPLAAAMGAAGRARADRVFGLTAHAQRLSAIYASLRQG